MAAIQRESGELAPLLPDECEQLWDAFESVEQQAMKMTGGEYTRVKDRDMLLKAIVRYRELRDRIERARRERWHGV